MCGGSVRRWTVDFAVVVLAGVLGMGGFTCEAVAQSVESAETDEPTAADMADKPSAPARPAGVRSVSFRMRPVGSLDVVGGGVIGGAAFQWAFEAPLLLEVQAEPLGFGVGNQPAVLALGGDLSVSYDSRLLRVGLGAGASGIATPRRAFGDDAPLTKHGFTAVQTVRIGARDGLHVEAHNSFISFDGGIEWGDIYASLQVPLYGLIEDVWVIGSGVHQRAGQSFGEIGARVLTSGDGGRGSTFLEGTVGWGGIWGSETVACSADEAFGDGDHGPCTAEVLYLGPMVGIGLERRF